MSNPDQTATITSIASAAVATAALVLSIVNYIESRQNRVRWLVEIPDDPTTRGYSAALRNTSDRFAGVIVSLEDPDKSGDPAIRTRDLQFPLTVEPGNAVPIIWVAFDRQDQPQIRITWRQRRANGWIVRPWKRTVVLYRS